MSDRGLVPEGMAAELIVYDLDALAARPVEVLARSAGRRVAACGRAEGYRLIIVNGQVTLEDGKCTHATPGQLLRFGKANGHQTQGLSVEARRR